MTPPIIVWFRNDLRLTDNPALAAAATSGAQVVPVYIHDRDPADPWLPGKARQWWLQHSLAALTASLRKLGATLVVRSGRSVETIAALVEETGASAVCWNRGYDPVARARDQAMSAALAGRGAEARMFNAALLFEPHLLATRGGQPFKVFTPFWRACLAAAAPAKPLPAPRRLTGWDRPVSSDALPTVPDATLAQTWTPGERAANARLDEFLSDDIARYTVARDRPAARGTSCLSPHLAAGEIGPRQIWHAAQVRGGGTAASGKFLAELGWREFAAHLLWHFPTLTDTPMRGEFARFPWRDDPAALAAWQAGTTGYPIVDAGMRELAATGTMHNRVRMVVASFLTKHLLLPWQGGARWFWEHLVDADLASNAMNWQWVTGCGADAAPYFRIFNPVLQGEKFDPDGAYVRRFVPELARLPDAVIHQPWSATPLDLAAAGVRLGGNYPQPVVDHAAARARALAAFATIRRSAT